mmetsp:Transcript_15099/g.25041  ORF Transcript_15099/g.25041 Transcript_15099/m.25041 type:complete len:414 (-) Transcript_15099:71-1312(-)
MGGNALTNGLTERKQREDYLKIKEIVLNALQDHQRSSNDKILDLVTEIVEMPEKESFGDLDLLYVSAPGKTGLDINELITEIFSPTEIVKSGNVTSFDFMKFQIDMIRCTQSTFGMSRFCLSYGDRGMILGQMAKCRGFSLGTKGLAVKHPAVEELLGYAEKNIHISSKDEIVLTTDPAAIRAFMGLPVADEGGGDELQSQQEVMQYCLQAPWFEPHWFAPRKLNNCESRKKLNKRPFYQSFCDRVTEEYNLADLVPPTPEEKVAEQAQRLGYIREGLDYFGKTHLLEEIRQRQERQQAVREKLSHTLFLALGVEKKSLTNARSSFTRWLLQRSEEGNLQDASTLPPPPSKSSGETENALSTSHDGSDSECSEHSDTINMKERMDDAVLARTAEQLEADMTTWYEEVWQQEHS